MKNSTAPGRIGLGMALAALLALAPHPMRGQDYPDQGGIQQAVARISYIDGNDASYSRGDDSDNWQAAVPNVPLTLGDRVYTGDASRMELEVHGGALVRLAPRTDLTVLNLTDDVKQLSLAAGTASFRVRRMKNDEVFEVDSPNAAVTFDTPGNYRLDVDDQGNSRVLVRSGHVTVSAEGGEIPVSSGNEISLQGFDNPSYDVVRLGGTDEWDRWVGFRDSKFRRVNSYQYVNADIVGGEDLDQYGRWQDVPGYGQCWTPSSVAAGWVPYRDGQWIWQDPWGWTWVGAEPWGWAPYHYGRWFVYGSQWYWAPAPPTVAVAYAPAVVGFVGGGPGWSATVAVGGGGYVGWFPLAPHDPFVPWWGGAPHAAVNVTNATYVNKTYVTVVNQNTFVSGGFVARNTVRDPQVIRQVTSAPVARGPIPVVPTAASLRVASAAARPAPRPPAFVAQRAVVTRVAPPPAPAPFQAKARVIEQNRGAPVAPRAAAQLSIQEHNGARAAVPIRPAAGTPSAGVALSPRRADVGVHPQAVTAPRGKALATEERPLVTNPTVVDSKRAEMPARIAPGAVAPRGGGRESRTIPPGQQRQEERRQINPPPGREAPPPPRREAAPEERQAPPPHAEGERPAPRAQAPPDKGKANGNGKDNGKDNKGKDNKKKEEPPPPPPAR
ncbi:MAG TPA: DUF6600 domain-containing protein [Thermoanaerobaculia bacterium]|nr:DUF6600 domain-containing protein [Thermoanaerobaculia bacterium]